jgi:nucleotide-binding universal stress UspA family protein
MPRSGPVLIAFDGTAAAEHAIREAGPLLAGRKAAVLVVWKQGLGFELVALPATDIGLPPATIDIDTALEIDHQLYEAAESQSHRGAAIAREVGLDAEPLVVADDPGIAINETILRVADERGAAAILIGAHGHGVLSELILGSTARGVLRHAKVPVVVVRHPDDKRKERSRDAA